MQPISPRLLRAEAEAIDPYPIALTTRQKQREARILAVGAAFLARHTRHGITMRGLGLALRLGTAAIQFHFVDIDALLGEIILRHLRAIVASLSAIPNTHPDCLPLRRQAYLLHTRAPYGGHTETHLLFLRDCCILPDDLRIPLESLHAQIGAILAGPAQAEEALALLDSRSLQAERIETMLASRTTQAETNRPQQPVPVPALVLAPAPIPTAIPAPAPTPIPTLTTLDGKPGDWVNNLGLP